MEDQLVIERDAGGPHQLPAGDLFIRSDEAGPAVVLLHGSCGRREDLTQFAVALAQHGASVLNASWRGPATGSGFELARLDVEQALAFARLRLGRPATLAAWSDGTLVGAVTALSATDDDAHQPAAFVGLAGYYGWPGPDVPADAVNERTVAFLGGRPTDVPERWQAANPYSHLASATPGRSIVLATGAFDPQRRHTAHFYDAVAASGHPVVLHSVDECDHYEIVVPRHPPGRTGVRLVLAAARASDRW